MHDELTRRVRAARRAPLFDVGELTPVGLAREEIERLLPHRGSMLLVDRILGVDPDAGRVAAARRIADDDPVFVGHFPGDPVYPGVLQMESVGQAGLCLRYFCEARTTRVAADVTAPALRLIRVLDAQFLGAVRPGDEVTMLCEVVEDNGYTFTTLGQMLRDGEPVSAAVFEAMLFEEEGDA